MTRLVIEIDLDEVARCTPPSECSVAIAANALRSYITGIEALQHIPREAVALRGLRNAVVGGAQIKGPDDA